MNVNDLVSKAVADAAREAEQEDSAAGIASVVTYEPAVISSTTGDMPSTETPAEAAPETTVSPNAVGVVDAADVAQASATSTPEGGA